MSRQGNQKRSLLTTFIGGSNDLLPARGGLRLCRGPPSLWWNEKGPEAYDLQHRRPAGPFVWKEVMSYELPAAGAFSRSYPPDATRPMTTEDRTGSGTLVR